MSPSEPTTRGIYLLVNTRSLKGAEWLEEAKDKLEEKSMRVDGVQSFTKTDQLVARVRELSTQDNLVIVGGGDGTLSAAANVLAKSRATMGVLPLGTGNAFARDLGIPTDLDKAVDILCQGRATEVDLGVCEGKYFLNVVTIGLTATIAKTLTVPLKRRFGRYVYAIALVKALRKLKPFTARIETENGLTEIEAVQLVIGNGRYHAGPLPLSFTAAITSGSLHLYAVEAGTTGELLKYALLLPTGLQGILKTVHSEDTVGGTISTTYPESVVVDGELAHKTPVSFSIEPRALTVMASTDFKG